ncbi:MAG: DUF3394 domain-containing protein, partial [Vibrio sp.]
KAGIDFDWEIQKLIIENDRPLKEWVFIPALLITLLLAWNQRRRAKKQQ